jgi:hypothetical protein
MTSLAAGARRAEPGYSRAAMLGLRTQLVLAGIEAPTAVRRLGKRSAIWLAIYLAAATTVLGVVAWAIITHHRHVLELLLDYILPEEWQFAARLSIERFFAQQEQAVITNAALVASLMAVQITLFPIKEMVSASLEKDADLVGEPTEEHPLWFQAWEEIKLFVFLLVAQGTIFWIGYSTDPARGTLAMVLSYIVLFASVAVDFLSPVLQRHKLGYSSILKSMLSHPVLTFGFGAVFAAPSIVAAKIALDHPTWSFTTQLVVSFGAQVVGIALAAIGGTVAGAHLIPDARTRKRSGLLVRVVAWVVLLGLLAFNSYRFIAIGRSLHHKSQILKCDYAVDWSSFRADVPTALELALAIRNDTIKVSVSFDVTVTNATATDVEIEDNRLEAVQHGQLVAQTRLPAMHVRAGTTEKVHVELPLIVKPSQVMRIRELVTTKEWSLTLYLRVADNFTFPVYLLATP